MQQYPYLCGQINRRYEFIRHLYQKHRPFPFGKVRFPMPVLFLFAAIG